MKDDLLYYAILYDGEYKKIKKAILNNEFVDYNQLEIWKKQLRCLYVTILDLAYPLALRCLDQSPYVIFYYGDLSILNQKNIAVIGMRKPSLLGIKQTSRIVKDLTQHQYYIVSGMAYGIDTVAHQTALAHHGKTIAVLGCGIDYCYPQVNQELYQQIKEDHLLMSEHPGSIAPKKEYFPMRNRIIAALGDSLLVMEAKQKSGTMITVGYGLDLGKDIYCYDSKESSSEGCRWLISLGAIAIKDAQNIYEFENKLRE